MKWRPISELSDEQRDGRWVIFARETYDIESEGYSVNAKHICEFQFLNGRWRDECLSAWSDVPQSIPDFCDYFLSEPLPDLPKPQKMEWRKFEDEMPQGFPVIILLENKDIFSKRILIIENACALEKLRFSGQLNFWMPIIPPEGE